MSYDILGYFWILVIKAYHIVITVIKDMTIHNDSHLNLLNSIKFLVFKHCARHFSKWRKLPSIIFSSQKLKKKKK